MMHIGIVVRTLRIGGMERVAANLADAFQSNGHTVTLIYLRNKPVEILPENKETDIRLIDLDKKTYMTGIGLIWVLLARILNSLVRKSLFVWKGLVQSAIFKKEIQKIEAEKGRFDLFILRGQGTFEMIWNYKDPRVVQVCENIFSQNRITRLTPWYSGLLFNGKKVVCVSSGVLENFKDFQTKTGITPESVRMITNPIDTQRIGYRADEKPDGIPDEKYILGLGRFVKQKNFPLLIKAYKILVETYQIQHRLVLAGDGKERENLVELVSDLGLSDHVLFPGATDKPYAWMKNADLFVLSSDFEGLGMVIIEAFASGTNVVATNSPGGVSDIMSHGLLKEQLSDMTPESLASVIDLTLKKEMPVSDINQVLQRFNPDKIIADFLEYTD